jgi:hypothetical protein
VGFLLDFSDQVAAWQPCASDRSHAGRFRVLAAARAPGELRHGRRPRRIRDLRRGDALATCCVQIPLPGETEPQRIVLADLVRYPAGGGLMRDGQAMAGRHPLRPVLFTGDFAGAASGIFVAQRQSRQRFRRGQAPGIRPYQPQRADGDGQ